MDVPRIRKALPRGRAPLGRGEVRARGVPERVLARVGWPERPADPRPFVEEAQDLLSDMSLTIDDLAGSLHRRGSPRGEILYEIAALESAFFPPCREETCEEETCEEETGMATTMRVWGLAVRNFAALLGGVVVGVLQGLADAAFILSGGDDDDDDDKKDSRDR